MRGRLRRKRGDSERSKNLTEEWRQHTALIINEAWKKDLWQGRKRNNITHSKFISITLHILIFKEDVTMPHNPELVDGTDLDAWAPRREAQELLPRLMRRLWYATPGITDLSARAGEGIGVPGWDGRIDGGAGTAFVPSGESRWEMGTGDDPREQAQANYRKRTDEPLGVTPVSTTFVFVTLRRWRKKENKDDKESWIHQKQEEGRWRKVVAYDADDLEAWLIETPAVHIWLSEQMNRRPLEVQTLDRWWKEWSKQTQPVFPAGLLLAGRRYASRHLREMLDGTADTIGISSGSRDEAVAFLAASFVVPDEGDSYIPEDDPLAKVLVVSSKQAWVRLAASPSCAILVPDFDEADVAVAVSNGHHVLVPMGNGDRRNRSHIVLPSLARDEARSMLQAAGWSFEHADRLAVQARRSLLSLRRAWAVNPMHVSPGWACRPTADRFAPLMLVGGWSASPADQADCAIVATVVGCEYAQLERDLAEWTASDDPPFRCSAFSWRLVAPLDAWALLYPTLTQNDISRWRDAALRILAEPNPVLDLPLADQPFAAIHKVRRLWSDDLRRGIAQGAALLGAAENIPLGAGKTGPDHAAILVSELLTKANDDTTGRVWQSISDVLPLLAEAAPRQFLDGVDAGLTGELPLLQRMFIDSQNTTLLHVSSPHIGLLCALETLCWSSEYLSRAVEALARLAAIEPNGQRANRPITSLRDVFLPWRPRTSAPPKRQLAVINGLLTNHPDVGWPLLLALLPHIGQGSQDTYAPMFRFRDWTFNEEEMLPAEYLEIVHQLVNRALVAVAQQPDRWVQFIDRLQFLSEEDRNQSLNALENTKDETFDPETRFALWSAVTTLVARHRQFPTARWVMADEPLKRLEAIAERIQPVNLAERYAHLFDWCPYLPDIDRHDITVYDNALEEIRCACVRETQEQGGTSALHLLAAKSKVPHLVGMTVAKISGENLAGHLLPGLATEGSSWELTVGWIIEMNKTHGWNWVRNVRVHLDTLPDQARSTFYQSLRTEPRTWDLVDAEMETVQENYYRTVNTFGITADNAIAFAERLLDHNRPWPAINLLADHCDGNNETEKPSAEIIERALQAALNSNVRETPQSGSLDYDIGVLLNRLEATEVSSDTLFQLEWAYFPLLLHPHSSRGARTVLARLATDPQMFVEAVYIASGREQEMNMEDSNTISPLRRNCILLLDTWKRPPGVAGDGTIDEAVLRLWVDEARRLFIERDCADIGDRCIGRLLSSSSLGADGVWPPEPVRDMIRDFASKDLENGLVAGKFYSQGVTSRGVYDGGKREMMLANQCSSWSEQVEDQWPSTGRILRELADWYTEDARREDASAEKRADGG
jgi:hypothetical protein